MTPGHREALAQLQYGVQERKGFVVLSGNGGTGKATLLHSLLQRLDGQTEVVFVFNSALSFNGILEYALQDLGVPKTGESRAQRLIGLNNFLIERERAGQNTILILDEAQNLDAATLEQVRLLSNFETPKNKLLQILLVGQPELQARLQIPELQQLRQRVGLRSQIAPLTAAEARTYIRTRLRIAGSRDLGLFSDPAVDRTVEYSVGVPRLINVVCDHCLLFGYADQKRRIDRQIVGQAVEYLEEGTQPRRRARRSRAASGPARVRWIVGTLAVAPATAAVALDLRFDTTVLGLMQSVRGLLSP